MARKKDLYSILGVNQKADSAKIKTAYRKAAKKYHPDISPKDEEKFREIQEAYETLSDPEKRGLYDLEISRRSVLRPSPYGYSHPLRTRPSSLFYEINRFFSTFEDFWMDRWPDFFGEREPSRIHLSVEITLTPLEARKGCKIPLEIPFLGTCRRCRGTGYVKGLICGSCRGHGNEKIQKRIHFTIPSGVKDGLRIRIPLKDADLRRMDLVATLRVSA